MSLKVGVIGAGAMGTAISQIISNNVDEILLYARRKEICDSINKTRFNKDYFPNIKLFDNIKAVNDFNEFDEINVFFCVFLLLLCAKLFLN